MWGLLSIIVLVVLIGGEKIRESSTIAKVRKVNKWESEHPREVYFDYLRQHGYGTVCFFGKLYQFEEVKAMLDRIENGLFPIGSTTDLNLNQIQKSYQPLEEVENYIRDFYKLHPSFDKCIKGGWQLPEDSIRYEYRTIMYKGSVLIGMDYASMQEMTIEKAKAFVDQAMEDKWNAELERIKSQ